MAMHEFEELTGIKLLGAFEEGFTIDVASKILWVMLKKEDKDLTLEDTLELVDEHAESVIDVINIITEVATLGLMGSKAIDDEKNAPPPAVK